MTPWMEISEAVRRAWGAPAQYDLETRGGFAGELLKLIADVEPEVWRPALAAALQQPAPRSRIGVVLTKALREAIAEEGRRLPTHDVAVGNDTPYMRALAERWAEIEAETATSCP